MCTESNVVSPQIVQKTNIRILWPLNSGILLLPLFMVLSGFRCFSCCKFSIHELCTECSVICNSFRRSWSETDFIALSYLLLCPQISIFYLLCLLFQIDKKFTPKNMLCTNKTNRQRYQGYSYIFFLVLLSIVMMLSILMNNMHHLLLFHILHKKKN